MNIHPSGALCDRAKWVIPPYARALGVRILPVHLVLHLLGSELINIRAYLRDKYVVVITALFVPLFQGHVLSILCLR